MTNISEINADDRKVIELDRQAERRKQQFTLYCDLAATSTKVWLAACRT
jgi:hypothetical protein